MKPTDFAVFVTKYFTEYLSGQRNLSPNTIASYRDTFTLLLSYMQSVKGLRPEKIALASITSETVSDFLLWLEDERHSSITTRNQRLAAIHAFFQFVQGERPELMFQCQKVLSIKTKKHQRTIVNHISEDAIAELFSSPDITTPKGRRDLTLLCVLYDTGARVQELIDLVVLDIHLQNPAVICLHGKGGKTRHVPIMKQTFSLLSAYLEENKLLSVERQLHPVFFNIQKKKLTRSGVTYILNKYTKMIDVTANGKGVTPHVLRHTKAMHLLQSDVNLIFIRDFLGHSDVTTTEVYARADAEMKRRAFERIDNSPVPAGALPAWHDDKNLMSWLKNLGK